MRLLVLASLCLPAVAAADAPRLTLEQVISGDSVP
jgi:hypothetical protein